MLTPSLEVQQRPTGKHRACLPHPQPEPAELKCTKAQASASFKKGCRSCLPCPVLFCHGYNYLEFGLVSTEAVAHHLLEWPLYEQDTTFLSDSLVSKSSPSKQKRKKEKSSLPPVPWTVKAPHPIPPPRTEILIYTQEKLS